MTTQRSTHVYKDNPQGLGGRIHVLAMQVNKLKGVVHIRCTTDPHSSLVAEDTVLLCVQVPSVSFVFGKENPNSQMIRYFAPVQLS